MNTKEPRPVVTDQIIAEAARIVAESTQFSSADLLAAYKRGGDGYAMAKYLDDHCGYDISAEEVEEIDCLTHHVSSKLRAAELLWAKENNIQPPLPDGTRIEQGVIDHVYEHGAARYCVKENGCTRDGRFVLIKFEDAKEVDNESSIG